MAFNPLTLSLNYQPFSGTVPNATSSLEADFEIGSVRVTQSPNYLTAILGGYVLDESGNYIVSTSVIVSVNTAIANTLAPGYYQGQVEVTGRYPGVPVDFTFGLPVTLRVLEYVPLSISPAFFYYLYLVGDPAPPNRYFHVTAQNSWSVVSDASWLTFSQNNGNGSSNVSLLIDFNLPNGQHNATILVEDGQTQVYATVIVVIFGGSVNEYTIVNPGFLEFSESYLDPPQDSRNFTIDTTLPATITADVGWLQFSLTNIPAGFTTVQVSTIGTQALSIGIYPATITVNTTEGDQLVNVVLIIIKKQYPEIKNNGFYFAEDRNLFALSYPNPNLEAVMNFIAQGLFGFKNYVRKAPYFRNTLSVVVGLETRTLLLPEPLPPLASLAYAGLKPIRYDLKVYNQTIGVDADQTLVADIQNMTFINGHKPVISGDNRTTTKSYYLLSYLPSEITAPKDGVIAFSFRYTGSNIKLSVGIGPFASNNDVEVPDTQIYTIIINLSDYNLSEGKVVTVACLTFLLKITIKDTQNHTTHLCWLNEWDLPEILNCTGPIDISEDEDDTTTTLSVSGKNYEKVLETKAPLSFEVNTGNIYSLGELKQLATIVRSKKIWLETADGDRYEVVRNFKSIDTLKGREFIRNINLKFKSATS